MEPFRQNVPVRTCQKKYSNYQQYKTTLRVDFNCRCGYCNDHDKRLGGSRTYHIDHLAPQSIYPEKANEYNNLVYSCPFCNGAKSDNELIHTSYGSDPIDPCSNSYSDYFIRNLNGTIIPTNEIGIYLFQTLNLGLIRHSIAWSMDYLENLMNELKNRIDLLPNSDETCILLREFTDLTMQYINFNNSIND